jgi:uncharacterized membrane protein YdcZ (DUF606 family)
MEKELIAGIILMAIGVLFFFNNKNMGKGASKFYKWFCTEERLKIMFRVIGIVLVLGGLVLVFVN